MLWAVPQLSMLDLLPLQWSAVLGASLLAAILDIRTRRVPNLLTGSLLGAGLLRAAAGGPSSLAISIVACLLLSLPFVLLFVFAGGGAGDAKLMGAIGSWLGIHYGLIALATVTISGGLIAIGLALVRREEKQVGSNLCKLGARFFGPSCIGSPAPGKMMKMPYCPAIFVGVFAAAIGVLA